MLKVLKKTPYTVMEVEVGIPDSKPSDGEPSKWGADEGTRLEDLELEVCTSVTPTVLTSSPIKEHEPSRARFLPPTVTLTIQTQSFVQYSIVTLTLP